MYDIFFLHKHIVEFLKHCFFEMYFKAHNIKKFSLLRNPKILAKHILVIASFIIKISMCILQNPS